MIWNKQNCIFISVNQNFIDPLKICLYSLKENYPQHPPIIIYHTNLSEAQIQDLLIIEPNCFFLKNTFKKREIGPIMDHLPAWTDPKVFYARLALRREKVFKGYNNILHLDVDTVVLKNLDDLFQQHTFYIIKEAYTWECSIFRNHYDENLLYQLKKDNILLWDWAYNWWVFLLPANLRDKKQYHSLVRILQTYKKFIKRADQSVLNIRLYKNSFLGNHDFKYNYQHRLLMNEQYDTQLKNASIIHFNWVHYSIRSACMQKLLEIANDKKNIGIKYRQFYDSLLNDPSISWEKEW